jgi:threonine/homoserine/homoserine lactone efflux protein
MKTTLAWFAVITGTLLLIALPIYALSLPADSETPPPSIFAYLMAGVLIYVGWKRLRAKKNAGVKESTEE